MSLEELNLPIQVQILTDIARNQASLLDHSTRDQASALTLQLLYGPCLDYVQCAAFDYEMGDEFRSRISLWTQLGLMRRPEAITKLIQLYDERLPDWRTNYVPLEYQPKLASMSSTSRAKAGVVPQRREFSIGLLESLLGSFIHSPEGKAKILKEKLIGSILQKVTTSGKTAKSSPKKRKDLTRTKSALLDLRATQRHLLKDLKSKLSHRDQETNESLALCIKESSALIGRLIETVCDTGSQSPSILYIKHLEEDLHERLDRVKEGLLSEADSLKTLTERRQTLKQQMGELKECMLHLKEMHDPVISLLDLSVHDNTKMVSFIHTAGQRFHGIKALSDLLEDRHALRGSQKALLLAKEAECTSKRQILSEAQVEEYKHNDRFAKQLKGQMTETQQQDGSNERAVDLLDKIEEKRQMRLFLLSELQRRREMLQLLQTKQNVVSN